MGNKIIRERKEKKKKKKRKKDESAYTTTLKNKGKKRKIFLFFIILLIFLLFLPVYMANAARMVGMLPQELQQTMFFEAVKEGSTELVKNIMTRRTITAATVDAHGYCGLHYAAQHGFAELVRVFLDDLRVDVNLKSLEGLTPLSLACIHGRGAVVSLLLAHHGIDVNTQSGVGNTPLHLSCGLNWTEVTTLLLAFPAIQTDLQDNFKRTPLWMACNVGNLTIVRHLMLSRKDLSVGTVSDGNPATDALGVAIFMGHSEIADLVERYTDDPERARRKINHDLGVYDANSANVFASIVFLSDGLLAAKPAPFTEEDRGAARFFEIAQKLPLDLQMILARRTVGSMRDFVLSKYAEPAYVDLARSHHN